MIAFVKLANYSESVAKRVSTYFETDVNRRNFHFITKSSVFRFFRHRFSMSTEAEIFDI